MILFNGRDNNKIISRKIIFRRTMGRLLLAALISMSGTSFAQVQAVEGQGEMRWSVNFNDTDIQDVIKSIAGLTGKTIIIDPKVRGPIKVINTRPLNAKELYELFLASLDVHGFTAVESGNIVRVVMNRDARQFAIPTENNIKDRDDLYITQVIPLKNTSAAKILAALRPLVPQYGHLTTYEPSNALIITDTRANAARISELVVQLDKIGITHTDVIPLRYANAADVVAMLTQLEKPDPNRGMTTAPPVIVADKRTNAVVVSGDDLTRQRLKFLINDLDRPQSKNSNVRVYYLKYAKAEDVAKVLSAMLQSLGQGKQAEGAPNVAQPAVQADEATNSVLITADVDTMDTLLSIVDSLDIRRAQVLVEAIIVEITGNNAKEIGIEWMYQSGDAGFGGFTSGSALGTVAAPALNILENPDDTTALAALAGGINSVGAPVFGVGRLGGKVDFLSVLKLLQTTESTNILSTPSLLTTDNTEASILVGQQVPFVTGSYTSANTGGTTGSSFASPFNTVNREDVGVKLQVTPHINEGDSLVLDIEQEISSVIGNTQNSPNGPTTSKREIKTQILAGDGQTVVLGGLIEDQVNKGDRRVPVLGSIPILGHLFRTQSATKRKTNLLIFLKATIIRDDRVLVGATAEKYQMIREQQIQTRRSNGLLLNKSEVPVLPEWEEQIERYRQSLPADANASGANGE
ncbi:type II secretion system secretin GspD [Cellvibrio sp. PSBB023]|uniref:type II secretion system secretin GspD n=1 Tax=Cellvibrio sp. PSBB023 TaxID=1945512 RepID=UPI00098FB2DB|nr:type II secretion system secretin GspD [Cellvibrio sp. PSBB023]AQT61539.1 type II secretion system protein GspD [Cellvibrio sp. PSBB023]